MIQKLGEFGNIAKNEKYFNYLRTLWAVVNSAMKEKKAPKSLFEKANKLLFSFRDRINTNSFFMKIPKILQEKKQITFFWQDEQKTKDLTIVVQAESTIYSYRNEKGRTSTGKIDNPDSIETVVKIISQFAHE